MAMLRERHRKEEMYALSRIISSWEATVESVSLL